MGFFLLLFLVLASIWLIIQLVGWTTIGIAAVVFLALVAVGMAVAAIQVLAIQFVEEMSELFAWWAACHRGRKARKAVRKVRTEPRL